MSGIFKKVNKFKKFWFVVFFCSAYFLYQLHQHKDIQVSITNSGSDSIMITMPLKDKKSLEYFFKYIVLWEAGGYTLLGDKAMWMGVYFEPFCLSSFEDFVSSITPKNFRFIKGLKTWNKYQHLFPNPRFELWMEENPFWYENSPVVSVLLVDKKKLKLEVQKHMADFQTILGKNTIYVEELLKERENKPFLKTVLKCHDGLIGTLFGYGRDNAWLFEARNRGEKVALTSMWEEKIYEFYSDRNTFTWRWLGLFPKDISSYTGYPLFAAIPDSSESKQLRQTYLKNREQIIGYYKDKDFLEATLALFCEQIKQE